MVKLEGAQQHDNARKQVSLHSSQQLLPARLTGVVKGEGAQQHDQQQDAAGPHIHAAPVVANLQQAGRKDGQLAEQRPDAQCKLGLSSASATRQTRQRLGRGDGVCTTARDSGGAGAMMCARRAPCHSCC